MSSESLSRDLATIRSASSFRALRTMPKHPLMSGPVRFSVRKEADHSGLPSSRGSPRGVIAWRTEDPSRTVRIGPASPRTGELGRLPLTGWGNGSGCDGSGLVRLSAPQGLIATPP